MKIKICGLSRAQDIEYVNAARPDWCGFVIGFPQSRRSVTPERARALVQKLDRTHVSPVGVFVDAPAEGVAALLNEGALDAAQLHGGEDEDYIARLRALAPGKAIWKAFKVRSAADLAAAAASGADMVLLDNGYGTGAAFDWSLAEGFSRPFLLAGGLTPENLAAAAARLRPMGADLSSGVETNGFKDFEKIRAAVSAARRIEL
jgi:phosphoribosylanthranilate isomerase